MITRDQFTNDAEGQVGHTHTHAVTAELKPLVFPSLTYKHLNRQSVSV